MITDDEGPAFDPRQLVLPLSGRSTCPVKRSAELIARAEEAHGRWAPARVPNPDELAWTHEEEAA